MALQFEWDDIKEKLNIQKHGIDFQSASFVFLDPCRLEFYDKSHSSDEEDRFITIGFVQQVLTVVYTERGERLRIISARKADRKERDAYYGNEVF